MSRNPHLVYGPPLEFIGAVIDKGRVHLRQETNPVRQRELEELINRGTQGNQGAVEKLWALEQQRDRENAAWAAKQERKRRAEKKYAPSSPSVTSDQSSHYQTQRLAAVCELFNSLDADPTRRERERKEAQERERREQERQKQERERIRIEQQLAAEQAIRQREATEKRKAIESWNQHFVSYRSTKKAGDATYFLQKFSLSLNDDNVGEKFLQKFWYLVPDSKRKENFIETMITTFSKRQLNEFKDIIYRLAVIVGDKDIIISKIMERKKSKNKLQQDKPFTIIDVQSLKEILKECNHYTSSKYIISSLKKFIRRFNY